eukprot:GEMP01034849.1.p1 GENE.GEMP01034849.1~~GEMP01034849.1.p1  ORF type:complete len:451 (+),score=94.48 GEMP01034849.1:40-1392(+)
MSDMMEQAKKMGVNVDVFGEGNPFSDPSWYQAFNSPYYNDSHRKFRATIRDIMEEKIIPFTHEWDEAKEIPQAVFTEMGELGFNFMGVGKPYPYKYGKCPKVLEGVKIDTFHELIAIDELSRSGSGGVTWGLSGGLAIGLPPVMRFGSEEMKQRILPDVLAGKKKICLAITEPTAGSDVANIRCSARKDADGNYIVNGEKKWITNGIWADYFSTAVRTGESGFKGISFLLIERTMPGVTTRRMDCTGVWCSGTSYVIFEDVKVPKENIIGRENKGFKLMMKNFNHERFSICCQTNRFARVCLEESIKFANKRKTFGKKLIEHQVIRWKIAEMSRQVEASHAWLETVTYNIETMIEQEADIKLGGMTALLKVQCTKVFEYCARESAQIFGGLSYSRGGVGEKIERLNREVRAMAIPGGSEEILLDLGIRQMAKLAEMARHLIEKEQGQAKL